MPEIVKGFQPCESCLTLRKKYIAEIEAGEGGVRPPRLCGSCRWNQDALLEAEERIRKRETRIQLLRNALQRIGNNNWWWNAWSAAGYALAVLVQDDESKEG